MAFTKFYRHHHKLVSKFNVGLKSLLHQCLSEPDVYGDLELTFKNILGSTDFSDQLLKVIIRHKRNLRRYGVYSVIYCRKPDVMNNVACDWST